MLIEADGKTTLSFNFARLLLCTPQQRL